MRIDKNIYNEIKLLLIHSSLTGYPITTVTKKLAIMFEVNDNTFNILKVNKIE